MFAANKYGINEISAHLEEISNILSPDLNSFFDEFGCSLSKFYVTTIGVDTSTEGWRNMRKQISLFRFFREPDPVEDDIIRESLDIMKQLNCQKGFLFSSSGYSNSGRHFAEGRPIELVDKIKLEALLSQAGSTQA